jgi:Cu-Zn family superoxide dismutase
MASLLLSIGCERDPKVAPDPEPQQGTRGAPNAEEQTSLDPPAAPTVQDGIGAPAVYVDPGAKDPRAVSRAIAVMMPTEGNEASGTIRFETTERGVRVISDLTGLPSGRHGYHVHLLGNCSAEDGKSAGTHFNFDGSSKEPPKNIRRITGNLGDLDAKADGTARAEAIVQRASLQGRYSLIGRAVVIHEKPNDPNEPPIGAAGKRLACGVIGIDEG